MSQNFWGGFIGAFIGGWFFVAFIMLTDIVSRRIDKHRKAKAAVK